MSSIARLAVLPVRTRSLREEMADLTAEGFRPQPQGSGYRHCTRLVQKALYLGFGGGGRKAQGSSIH
jgi:hypothetical protein